ncbi:ZIP Zinc transporter [Plasmodiophora brassicae]
MASMADRPSGEVLDKALAISAAAGLITTVGASVVLIPRILSRRFLSASMAFAAGVMLYVSLASLIQQSAAAYAAARADAQLAHLEAVETFFGGAILTYLLDRITVGVLTRYGNRLQDPVPVSEDVELQNIIVEHDRDTETAAFDNNLTTYDGDVKPSTAMLRAAIITGVAISLHNLPEGLTTFMGLTTGIAAGLPLAFAIGLHNIPEGMAVALPVYYQTRSRLKGFLAGTLSGLVSPVGSLFGYAIMKGVEGDLDPRVYGASYGIVAGMMTYLAFTVMLPTAFQYDGRAVAPAAFAGLFVMSHCMLLLAFVKS